MPGTSSAFFEKGCYGIQGTIFLEMVCSMMFNSFLFAFFFSLLSKSEFRSTQIIFTDKLLVNVVDEHDDNKAYVRRQCYDIDSAHPLVEAHARMYFLDHKLRMHPLRLMDPNDDLGGALYPSVPADIVHHIDHHSALCPPGVRSRLKDHRCAVVSSHGVALRTIDSYVGNRDGFVCPVCGDSFGTLHRWKLHVGYNARLEEEASSSSSPPDDDRSHRGLLANLPPDPGPVSLEEVRKHMQTTLSEIIVVVEATDPQLSGSFQSLQSYKYEDIVFGEEFAKCVTTVSDNGTAFCVDMEQFHDTTCRSTNRPRPPRPSPSPPKRPMVSHRDSNETLLSALTETRSEGWGLLDLSEVEEGPIEGNDGVGAGGTTPAEHHRRQQSDTSTIAAPGGEEEDYYYDDENGFSNRTDDSRIVSQPGSTYFGRSYDTFSRGTARGNGWGRALNQQNSREDLVDDTDDGGDNDNDTTTGPSPSHGGVGPSSGSLLDVEEGSPDRIRNNNTTMTGATEEGVVPENHHHRYDDTGRTEDSVLVQETDKAYFGRSYDTFNSLRMRIGWGRALRDQNLEEDDGDGDDGSDNGNDGDGAPRGSPERRMGLENEPLSKPYTSTV